jgi:very-short-patch-repair endonuclease
MSTRTTPREPRQATGDSVETARGAPVTDWSFLAEDYARIGNIMRVARLYHCRFYAVRAELERQGIPIKPRGHVKGQKKSDHWREASARHWNDPAWRGEQRRKWIARLGHITGPAGWSPLESKLHEALKRARIGFRSQQPLLGRYFADILVNQAPVVIEADGALHYHPLQREHDGVRDEALRVAGYRVFRFTGTQIYADADRCIEEVAAAAGLVAEDAPTYEIAGSANPHRWAPAVSEEWRQANGARMQKLWGNPEWRRRWWEVRWGSRRQAVTQSALAGDGETSAETAEARREDATG